MFKIGDNVVLSGFDKPIFGTIISHKNDDGNVWVVLTDGGNHWDCSDEELSLA